MSVVYKLRILEGGPAPGSPGYQYLATISVADIVIIDIGYDFYILYCKTSVLGGSSLGPARDHWSRGTLDDAIQLVSLPQNAC